MGILAAFLAWVPCTHPWQLWSHWHHAGCAPVTSQAPHKALQWNQKDGGGRTRQAGALREWPMPACSQALEDTEVFEPQESQDRQWGLGNVKQRAGVEQQLFGHCMSLSGCCLQEELTVSVGIEEWFCYRWWIVHLMYDICSPLSWIEDK